MKKLGWCLLVSLTLLRSIQADESLWLTDLAKAQATAKEEKKLVLLDFTGSDWCPPCKALHEKVFTKKEFEDFAKKNLVLVLVDFPTHKTLPAAQQKANDQLQEKFKVDTFPTIILLDGDGKLVHTQTGYYGENAKEFVGNIEKVRKKG